MTKNINYACKVGDVRKEYGKGNGRRERGKEEEIRGLRGSEGESEK